MDNRRGVAELRKDAIEKQSYGARYCEVKPDELLALLDRLEAAESVVETFRGILIRVITGRTCIRSSLNPGDTMIIENTLTAYDKTKDQSNG